MYVIGIGGSEHDFSCALCKDGNIVVAIEEERVTRKKHSIGVIETLEVGRSVEYCLKTEGINRADVDLVIGNDLIKVMPLFGFKNYKVINHHLAHASSAYYMSGFDESGIIVVDAAGSNEGELIETATLAYGRGKDIHILKKVFGSKNEETGLVSNSIGQLYTLVTEAIGFKILQEGKTMGLAPYGANTYLEFMLELVELKEYGDYCISHESLDRCLGYIKEEIIKTKDSDFQVRADFAYAVQKVTDKVLLHMVKELKRNIDSSNLCYSGGVALNSVTNGELFCKSDFLNYFVQPASGDSGTALGASLFGYYEQQKNYKRNEQIKNIFLGKEYLQKEIDEVIEREFNSDEFIITQYESIEKNIANVLAADEVVCVFYGKSEFGPRALGHRSILASPLNFETQNKLNKIKMRESFRPFAPAVLQEKKKEYFETDEFFPFMLFVENVVDKQKNRIPAVTHVDGSARVQSVSVESNPFFYKIIKEFDAISKIPVVLNTSFNIGYEPIVETPYDAARSYKRSGIKWLAIGNYMIEKNIREVKMKIIKNDAVISREEENGETFLFNTLNGQFKKINQTGSLIWEICDQNTLEGIVEAMGIKFPNISKSNIEKDVKTFIEDLAARELISYAEIDE